MNLKHTSPMKVMLMVIVFHVIAASIAQAQTPSKKQNQPPTDEKLDVTDLENKYWSAKDSEFEVVQNRLYSKAGRFSLSVSAGTMINDPWTTGTTYGVDAGYYLSERWGIEGVYTATDAVDNQAVQRLKNQSGYPDHNQLRDFYGLQIQYVPFYAKMSVLSHSILYFDMSVAFGAGMQNYLQQKEEGAVAVSSPALTLDLTQTFFLNRTFAIRIDFKNRWYQEETMKYRASAAVGGVSRGNGVSVSNTSFLLIGLSLFY